MWTDLHILKIHEILTSADRFTFDIQSLKSRCKFGVGAIICCDQCFYISSMCRKGLSPLSRKGNFQFCCCDDDDVHDIESDKQLKVDAWQVVHRILFDVQQ
jgi:hypothetical protein